MQVRLCLAGVITWDWEDDTRVVLFSCKGGAWADRGVVMLDEFLLFHAPGECDRCGDGFLPFQIGYFNFDDENDLDAPMEPRVVGFSEELNSIFLQAEPGVYIINLESGQHQRVFETVQQLSFVYPYSFYTTGIISSRLV